MTDLNIKPEDKETKTKDQDLKDSLELFGEDKDNYAKNLKEQFQFEIMISKDSTDNIMKISRMIRIAVLTISGYEEVPTNDVTKKIFKLNKHPLASSDVIKVFETLLKPYSDESNIVIKKGWDSFRVQAMADWRAFYKFCLREKATPNENIRAIYRNFQGCLINSGEIICDNMENMKQMMGNLNKEMNDDYQRNDYK